MDKTEKKIIKIHVNQDQKNFVMVMIFFQV